ncbi:uncharacterized protein LOC143553684 [Bidens hawaiensis]|uniref:uncharacterized protein LOC143553684 n=1 Tax=Bidens hawaiensis TaxID=980011 RepID=UPI00404B0A0C
MGACISSSTDNSTSAFVVTNKGELLEYPTPIFVSEVLEFEKPSSFLCNSDTLYCDQRIQSLDQEQQLDAGQIYFILPKTMLRRRLTTTDMAALANKASHALDSHYSNKRNKNKARISPLETSQVNDEDGIYKQKPINGGLKVSRSRSIRKYSSKKARVSSLRLSTIYENEDCV